jgi:hypothetical protein
VVAVEVHQNNGGSSDLSFDFELTGVQSFIAPYITTQPQSQTVGEGSTASMVVVADGASPLRYQWRFHGTNLPGATNAAISFPSVQPSHGGGYAVVITNIAGSITSAVATLTVSTGDADGDGMPDAWELAHGLKANVNDSAFDPDGDTMTNLAEFIAGTDPQDAQSYLKVDGIAASTGTCLLRFNAVSNRTYSVLYRDSMSQGLWLKMANVSARPTNRVEIIADTNVISGARFYRLMTPNIF